MRNDGADTYDIKVSNLKYLCGFSDERIQELLDYSQLDVRPDAVGVLWTTRRQLAYLKNRNVGRARSFA